MSLLAQPSVDGTWQSDYGLMVFSQEENRVDGTYACCNGNVKGTIVGNRLDFSWADPLHGSGWGYFILEDSGNRLRGEWAKYGSQTPQGRWNAVREQKQAVPAAGTHWQVSGSSKEAGNLSGHAVLAFTGRQISGQLEGEYTLNCCGSTMKWPVFNTLQGMAEEDRWVLTWRNPADTSSGPMTLNRQGEVYAGSWQTHDATSGGQIAFTPETEAQQPAQKKDISEIFRLRQVGERNLRTGLQYFKAGAYEDSIKAYEAAKQSFQALDDQAKAAYADHGIGQCYFQLGRYEEAKQAYQRVLDNSGADDTAKLLAESGLEVLTTAQDMQNQWRNIK